MVKTDKSQPEGLNSRQEGVRRVLKPRGQIVCQEEGSDLCLNGGIVLFLPTCGLIVISILIAYLKKKNPWISFHDLPLWRHSFHDVTPSSISARVACYILLGCVPRNPVRKKMADILSEVGRYSGSGRARVYSPWPCCPRRLRTPCLWTVLGRLHFLDDAITSVYRSYCPYSTPEIDSRLYIYVNRMTTQEYQSQTAPIE